MTSFDHTVVFYVHGNHIDTSYIGWQGITSFDHTVVFYVHGNHIDTSNIG